VSAAAAQSGGVAASLGRKLAVGSLALAIVLGSAVLWIGIPIVGFWVAGKVTTSATGFLFFVLAAIPLAMVLMGWLLYRVNGLYEGLRQIEPERGGPSAWLVSATDERADFRRRRAPRALIDVAMTASAVAALVLRAIWFFFFAHMQLAQLP
jgi:hypothetical protein